MCTHTIIKVEKDTRKKRQIVLRGEKKRVFHVGKCKGRLKSCPAFLPFCRACYEVCWFWSLSSSFPSFSSQESASLSTKGEKAREGWLQCNRQLHHQTSKEENATWHLMHFSSLPHLINTTPFATTIPPTSTIATRAEVHEAAGSNIPINGSLETSNEFGQSQTLELFPLRSNGIVEKMPSLPVSPPITTTSSMDNLGPSQFFHFL